MTDNTRRSFFKFMGAGVAAATLRESITRAAAIPANTETGSIHDVEHIIVLMQENRSFDHYFGSLQGVRGFNDPSPARLTHNQTVWNQPRQDGFLLPFHPTAMNLGLQFIEDLPHDWQTTHLAWNSGFWNQWVPQKGTTTMAYLTRQDIPFHYALADAFTICDAYHCSIMSSTDPNRYYMWTGWVGNDGAGGGPVVDNAEKGYGWKTYPERLQAAGISWKVYQDIGTGLNAAGEWGWGSNAYIGNYGDNSLLYFNAYRNAPDISPLALKARTGTDISASGTLFDQLQADVKNGTLPQVTYIVAPEAYCEHPNWPANYGAWYIAQVLDILTANPEIWSRTALFLTFDENDGFFDHIVPPVPAVGTVLGGSTVSTRHEWFTGSEADNYSPGPYGLGPRVPMTVLSPWSRGGWVNSEVFDHTSIIRFIEKRFGEGRPDLIEPNITPWRRAVCGDLTSCFDFKTPNANTLSPLPSTTAYAPPDQTRHTSYIPQVPTTQTMPQQEPGTRKARPLPYDLQVHARTETTGLALAFANHGEAAAVFMVRDPAYGTAPRSYTVEPGKQLSDRWTTQPGKHYHLEVHGPNGFFRRFQGITPKPDQPELGIATRTDPRNQTLVLSISNPSALPVAVQVRERHSVQGKSLTLLPGAVEPAHFTQADHNGWYDVALTIPGDEKFSWRLAGHIENGQPSITDPTMGFAKGAS